jgi:hypothetical protein
VSFLHLLRNMCCSTGRDTIRMSAKLMHLPASKRSTFGSDDRLTVVTLSHPLTLRRERLGIESTLIVSIRLQEPKLRCSSIFREWVQLTSVMLMHPLKSKCCSCRSEAMLPTSEIPLHQLRVRCRKSVNWAIPLMSAIFLHLLMVRRCNFTMLDTQLASVMLDPLRHRCCSVVNAARLLRFVMFTQSPRSRYRRHGSEAMLLTSVILVHPLTHRCSSILKSEKSIALVISRPLMFRCRSCSSDEMLLTSAILVHSLIQTYCSCGSPAMLLMSDIPLHRSRLRCCNETSEAMLRSVMLLHPLTFRCCSFVNAATLRTLAICSQSLRSKCRKPEKEAMLLTSLT